MTEAATGLTGFPVGFTQKRAWICRILGELENRNATPWLAWTLDDPVLSVEAWACWALERSGREDAVPALKDYEARLRDRAEYGEIPEADGPVDRLLAQAARTRLALGDATARDAVLGFLLSDDPAARRIAIDGLEKKFGVRHGYEPDAPLAERRAAYEEWQQEP